MASETEPFLAVYSALQILGVVEALFCASAVEAAKAPAIAVRRVMGLPSGRVYGIEL
jgi:Na+-transporting NADH:ubiquinone oxidoreductase subunit NqrD